MIIGFKKPNDLAAVWLRVEAAKKFGIFGNTPFFGGKVKLHEYYPPLATLACRALGMDTCLFLIPILMATLLWNFISPLSAALFASSYFVLVPHFHIGRLPEFQGYLFIMAMFFMQNSPIAGILWGLGALSHPTSLIFGGILVAAKYAILILGGTDATYSIEDAALTAAFAAGTCAWWYLPFVLKSKNLAYGAEKRADKLFGIYLTSYASFANVAASVLGFWPFQLATVLWWACPVFINEKFAITFSLDNARKNLALFPVKPYTEKNLAADFPKINSIHEPVIALKDGLSGFSEGNYVWAVSAYLLSKGTVVENGMPKTEVPTRALDCQLSGKMMKLTDLK